MAGNSVERIEGALVTVVMAACAGDDLDFLREAIGSILAQTHRNLELLVVADGPLTADTQACLDALAAEDDRVRLLALDVNAGPAKARNTAIAEARGEYVAVLDADDAAVPERIERQLAFLEDTGADLVGSCYDLINAAGARVGTKRMPLTDRAIRRRLCLHNPIANSTVLAKADVLQAHPYYEPFRYGEDYHLWVTLARAGCKLVNIPEALVRFRVDGRFFTRRRGLMRFRTDLINKCRTFPLYRPFWWPLVAAAALCTSMVRLLPGRVLRVLYRVRPGVRALQRRRP